MNLETAKRLLKYRKLHNLSQEKLAEQIGVSRQAVSKWERGEASPDTDNLIALSKLYNISLDELVLGDADPILPAEKPDEEISEVQKAEPEEDTAKYSEEITEETETSNLTLTETADDEEFTDEDDLEEQEESGKRKRIEKALYCFPYPVFATILFFIYGLTGIGGGWVYGWLVFLTIPLYYTFIPAFFKRKPVIFCYPVFITWIYLFLGFKYTLWHPMWLLFLTIPLYYSVCSIFKK